MDTDLFNGHPDGGAGTPDSNFGAAAMQPGFWNAFPTDSENQPFQLRGLDGGLTSVTVSAVGTGGGFGYNNPANSGNYAKLLNDADQVGVGFTYTLNGLAPGTYRFYTYAVKPTANQSGDAFVTITGATTPNPQEVTGVMPGNQFIQGVTHSIHDVVVMAGQPVVISVDGPWPNAFVNGLQVVSVPEPLTCVGLFSGFGLIMFRTRRRT